MEYADNFIGVGGLSEVASAACAEFLILSTASGIRVDCCTVHIIVGVEVGGNSGLNVRNLIGNFLRSSATSGGPTFAYLWPVVLAVVGVG